MNLRRACALAMAPVLALAPFSASAAAVTVFFDDFAAEVVGKPTTGFSQINFSPLSQWDIVDGSVDLFTNLGFGLPCGSEGCLDLDGTTSNAARLESKSSFNFMSGVSYDLTLNISGKNGNGSESLTFGLVGGQTQVLSMPAGDNGARLETLSFIGGGSAAKLFIDHDGGDNFGILLDSVTLSADMGPQPGVIPLPATLPLVVGALAALGVVGARRRR